MTNGGEARVYSDSAGFTLKSGRGARVFVEGDNAGEWETADAARNTDEFDNWASDRDATIAKRIKDAYYDKYYDNDIYGADDLDAYGEWVHTSNYGYVWRPYKNSISIYADWSPYRYGHWRWVPPYGWTWVNDEPWGWATYHHGRWIYDNGYWVWTPYGYYRPSRSWWFPALVVINIINDNVCWYPLQYHHRYTAFNNHHGDRDRDRDRDRDHHVGDIRPTPTGTPVRPPVGIGPTPTRTPMGIHRDADTSAKRKGLDKGDPSADRVPANGVVAVNSADFGSKLRGNRVLPPVIANEILSRLPAKGQGSELPEYAQVNRRLGSEIITNKPRGDDAARQTKVGAADRRPDAPLDQELRATRIFGGRPPAKIDNDGGGIKTNDSGPRDTRKVGAVERPPVKNSDAVKRDGRMEPPEREAQPGNDPPRKQPPGYDSPAREAKDQNGTPPAKRPPSFESPAREVRGSGETPPTKQPPRNEPPQREKKPKSDQPPAKQPPRSEPSQREVKPPSESPKPSQPKSEPNKDSPAPKTVKDRDHG